MLHSPLAQACRPASPASHAQYMVKVIRKFYGVYDTSLEAVIMFRG